MTDQLVIVSAYHHCDLLAWCSLGAFSVYLAGRWKYPQFFCLFLFCFSVCFVVVCLFVCFCQIREKYQDLGFSLEHLCQTGQAT